MKFDLYSFTRNYIRIRPVGDELLHADGRLDGGTDMPKLTVAFRNFAIQHNNVFLEPLPFVFCK